MKNNHFIVLLICLVYNLSFALEAVEEKLTDKERMLKMLQIPDNRETVISGDYRRGRYLIYDCDNRHFACVNDTGFNKCQKWRKKAIFKMKEYMPCAPLKEFKSERLCDLEHYKLLQNNPPKTVCIRLKKY